MHCISNPVQSIKPPLPRCDLDLSHHVAFYCLIFVVGIISGNNVNCVCVVELKRRRSHRAHNTVRETIFQGLTSVPNQCLPLDFFAPVGKCFYFFGGKAVIGFVFKPLCFFRFQFRFSVHSLSVSAPANKFTTVLNIVENRSCCKERTFKYYTTNRLEVTHARQCVIKYCILSSSPCITQMPELVPYIYNFVFNKDSFLRGTVWTYKWI